MGDPFLDMVTPVTRKGCRKAGNTAMLIAGVLCILTAGVLVPALAAPSRIPWLSTAFYAGGIPPLLWMLWREIRHPV